MVPRAVLAIVAILVLVWTGVLLRNHEVGRDAMAARDTERLADARLLDPSVYWDQIRSGLYLLEGDARRATATAEELVRAEPESVVAWSLLRQATLRSDPERAREATAALRRLNPRTAP